MTFESFLTPEGIIAAGALATTLVSLVKGVLPPIAARFSGALLAFVVTGALYALTALATRPATLDAALTVFAAWLACATAAVGVHSAVKHARQ